MTDRERAERGFDASLSRSLRAASDDGAAEVCPNANILAAYAERALSEEERAGWEMHFASCGRCQEQLAGLARALDQADPDTVVEAGPWAAAAWRWDWRWMAPLAEPDRLSVLEQNYEYDLLEPQKLLQKYVGREVILVRQRQNDGTTTTEEVRAQLLAYNNGPVWRIGSEIVTGMHADHIRFPELPEDLYSRPTMVWSLANRGSDTHRVEAAYLAGNLSWNADYVLTVGRDDALSDLDGWVTLVNNSGTAFNDARLQLVAGDLHRVQQGSRRNELAAARAVAEAADAASFVEEAFSEYHLYSLGRRTSIRNLETKQISLLTGTGVPVTKKFVVDGQQFYYRNAQHPGSPLTDPVKVYYAFQNDEASRLGMPLPAGTVRVYQADTTGGVQFAGEDRIGHTPRDESLSLHIGNAFDIVSERKQTDYTRLSSVVHEIEFEITLKNHKDDAIVVEVNEPIGGDWQMLRASHAWTKTAAWAASFDVPVEPNGESVLRYRVRVRW